MTEDPGTAGMRASDADRERTATRLQEAHAEGRITLEELSERLDRAAGARTLGELGPLTSDLPTPLRPVASPPPPVPAPVPAPGAALPAQQDDRTTRQVWMGYAGVVAICLVVWGVTSIAARQVLYFWPIWVIGFGLIGPLSRAFYGRR